MPEPATGTLSPVDASQLQVSNPAPVLAPPPPPPVQMAPPPPPAVPVQPDAAPDANGGAGVAPPGTGAPYRNRNGPGNYQR